MMKILMVTPMPPQAEAPGAIPLVLHAQLSGLAERHDVTLVTVAGPDPHEWDALDQLRSSNIEIQAIRRVEPSGIQCWKWRWRLASTWLRGKYPRRTIWFWEPGLQHILDRLLTEQRFDLVQVEDNAMGIYRYRTTAPLVFTEHEVRRPRPINWNGWAQGQGVKSVLREADWHRWPQYHRNVWARFDRIQVFTPRDAALMQAIAPDLADRVRVNPFGIELPAGTVPHHEEQGSILFVGNFTHPPNVDAALWLGHEIMPLLRTRCPGVRLTIVGGWAPESVQALACDDTIVTGRVAEIEPYLQRAAVVLAPIRTGGGQRMKVLKAMAFGKAVVTTPRGAEGLAIAGFEPPLVIAEDAQGIAGATAALLAAADVRRKLGSRAHAFVAEHYSPAAYARRIEDIYAELLDTRVTA
jgi:glycosyltransferase involved in cell wall biosynthesis